MARVTCYDGVGCIGGNKILLEDGETKLWLDFGMDFGRMGRFYEEYLKPKSSTGIYELVQMRLLPPILDLYRDELICSNVADPWDGMETQTVGRINGIVLSHAHLDHVGLLPYIRSDIPIYCSAMTFAITKAIQDTGTGASSQYCYIKQPKESKPGGLITFSGATGAQRRPFVFSRGCPSQFSEFEVSASGRALKQTQGLSCGGLKVRSFPVDHSLYGACAWAVETSVGSVVYTGDLRCHGGQADLTWKFAEEVAKLKPRALIIEGTRIDKDDTCTEGQVHERALEEVGKAKGLVVADFGPRNIERLATFLEIGRQTGRRLVLLRKDAYLLDQMAMADDDGEVPSLQDEYISIYEEYASSSYSWKTAIDEKYRGKLLKPRTVAGSQGDFICCFSFWDVNELAYIKPVAGSIWIYSSCEPFNEEMRIDVGRLREWLCEYGVRLLGDPRADEKNPFHASGHACRSDLLKLIEIIRPQTVIPVHTEKPELYAEALEGKCEVVLPERGVPINL